VGVAGTAANPGDNFTVSITLAAQGNENAVGASVSFDPTLATFLSGSLGSDTSGATLYLNSSQAASGRLGFALAFGPGATFAAGNKELVRLNFRASASGTFNTAFADQPVPREVSDVFANSLPISFLNGSVLINSPPLLTITQANQVMALSWPLWASNFILQQASGDLLPQADWTTVTVQPVVSGNENSLSLPVTNSPAFFRLFHP
jgi:hypothetical protein